LLFRGIIKKVYDKERKKARKKIKENKVRKTAEDFIK
jgi:hypothetical protein